MGSEAGTVPDSDRATPGLVDVVGAAVVGVTMNQDTLIVGLSDLHSGGTTALFPNMEWWFDQEHNHNPTPLQRQIYSHWLRCAALTRLARRGRRMIVLHLGDAVEGFHHNTTQVATGHKSQQAAVHDYLMREFLGAAGFAPGEDKLIYVRGTEIHVGEVEHSLAAGLGAELAFAPDVVELAVNGRLLWLTHHGAGAGEGDTEGDSFRTWLKRVFWTCVKHSKPIPDAVLIGHRHKAMYTTYTQRAGNRYHTIHGMILPSWQAKTRYALGKVPLQVNEIGALFLNVLPDGTIRDPFFSLMETRNGEARLEV